MGIIVIPYWLMFLIPAVVALSERPSPPMTRRHNPFLIFVATLIAIMIGFRFQVGGDWGSYLSYLYRAELLSFWEVFGTNDPGYYFLNWIVARTVGEIWAVNLACGAIFSWGLIRFSRHQPRPWLAIVVAVPYLVIVVAMGYSRQAVAIGFAMLGIVALTRDRSNVKFAAWLALAATFHVSVIILAPVAALAARQSRIWTVLWIGGATLVLYYLLLEHRLDRYVYAYLEREYQSQGAAVRIAMNALPAAIFLLFRRRFPLAQSEVRFWTHMALLAILFIFILVILPSSTAVDRIALYLVPLQIFVLSRVPDAVAGKGEHRTLLALGVVAYSAAVQFVWFNFADNAGAWLPYQFYPVQF